MKGREGALRVLYEIQVKKAYSNIALNQELKQQEYASNERGFMTELVYGVLENQIYLDYVIGQFSSTKLKKIHPMTLNILRMGLYQLLFLDKVPPSAAVNEAVNLAKKYAKASSGFVNGILRSVQRSGGDIPLPDPQKDLTDYLSVKYSHPQWMVEALLKHLTPAFTAALLEANNETPPFNVRVNTLKTTVAQCIASLEEMGIQVEQSPHLPEALTLKGIPQLQQIPLLKKGLIYIQDMGSMLISRVLDPQPGELVLDLCSAPGGKTTHLAQLMENRGRIIARDIHPHKVKLIAANAKAQGASVIEPQVFDATQLDHSLVGQGDRVLIDAPCSGLGIIRRKPEIKYRKTLEDLGELNQLQLRILEQGAKYLKPGGTLVYSTCTIEPMENQGVVEVFLKSNPDFKLEDLGSAYPHLIPGEGHGAMIQLYPSIHGTDGFFMAKLKRV